MINATIIKQAIILNNLNKILVPEVHIDKHLRPDIVGFNKNK